MYCTPSYGPSHLQVVLLPPSFAWSLQVKPEGLDASWEQFRPDDVEGRAADVAARLLTLEEAYVEQEEALLVAFETFCDERDRLWGRVEGPGRDVEELLFEAPTGFAHSLALHHRRREYRQWAGGPAREVERWQERRWQEVVGRYLPVLGRGEKTFTVEERRQLLEQVRRRLALEASRRG